MKKLIFGIFSIFLFTSVFVSCNNTDDDREKPVFATSFHDNDTLYISSRDTNIFTVEMTDNEALSTLKIHLKCRAGIDTLSRDSTSAALQKAVYLWSLHNAKAAAVTDTFGIQTTSTYKTQRYPVSTGDTGIYELVVGCIDRAGNYDSIVYKVNLMYNKP
ncbi:MAG: DUF4625 domain-containing protein [Prevotella sp.]|jgi:hypothetical protein|nr:DUF4625 domain-containing protein [Prevotella sp.]